MKLKIYHNPRCRKSRGGLQYLEEKTGDYEIVEYIKNGITEDEIREILLKLNIPAQELVRTQEEIYRKELKGKNFNEDEWVKILAENPKLIRRPVVVGKHRAVIADPPANIDKMF